MYSSRTHRLWVRISHTEEYNNGLRRKNVAYPTHWDMKIKLYSTSRICSLIDACRTTPNLQAQLISEQWATNNIMQEFYFKHNYIIILDKCNFAEVSVPLALKPDLSHKKVGWFKSDQSGQLLQGLNRKFSSWVLWVSSTALFTKKNKT